MSDTTPRGDRLATSIRRLAEYDAHIRRQLPGTLELFEAIDRGELTEPEAARRHYGYAGGPAEAVAELRAERARLQTYRRRHALAGLPSFDRRDRRAKRGHGRPRARRNRTRRRATVARDDGDASGDPPGPSRTPAAAPSTHVRGGRSRARGRRP